MTEDGSPETTPEPQPTPEPEPTADAPPAAPDPSATPVAPTPGADDPAQENPTMAALAYIFCPLVGIIMLVTEMKKSRYMRFHAFHSIFLSIVLAMKAYNKQEMLLPVIGQMAADQADKMSV